MAYFEFGHIQEHHLIFNDFQKLKEGEKQSAGVLPISIEILQP
jgi:uncharacterized protein (DUF2249 family)